MTKRTIAVINESLNLLQKEVEQGEIYHRATLSTYEVTISQQISQIRKLEERILKIEEDWAEGWNLADSYNIKIEELQETIKELGERLEDTPESYCVQCLVDFGDSSLGCNVRIVEPSNECISCQAMFGDTPEPYPYTHPVRDIPNYSKVK